MSDSRQLWRCVIGLVVVFTFMGCAGIFSRERVKEEPVDNVKIAMSVKSKLLQEDDLKAAAIHVEAEGGAIQLSGFVETQSQRQLASTVARSVPGVQQVNNRIEVK